MIFQTILEAIQEMTGQTTGIMTFREIIGMTIMITIQTKTELEIILTKFLEVEATKTPSHLVIS